MLIRHSLPNYLLIRLAIFGLRVIAPLSLTYSAYCIFLSVFPRPDTRFPLLLEIWLAAESAFFLLAYLPLSFWLQQDAKHPRPPGKEDREILFQRCLDSIDDVGPFLSAWFLGSPLRDIKRENINEFYAWSFMNKRYQDVSDDELTELNHYADLLEQRSGFPIASEDVASISTTLLTSSAQIVFLVDCVSSARLLYHSFRFCPPGPARSFATFPPRLPHLLRWNRHNASQLSYWYREHTSKTKFPILFIHGINVGLYAYVNFIEQLGYSDMGTDDDSDGEVGIIALELLPIGSAICPPLPLAADLRRQIGDILYEHGWENFVLVGHSFGTAVAANLLRDPQFSERIKATLLMDPICFLLHLPDIAYNFTRRLPNRANEFMLHYFSSQDLLISHTLARRFFWSEHTIWKEDISGLPLTVILSGKDLIVPTEAVWRYLTNEDVNVAETESRDCERRPGGGFKWERGSLRILWFDALDHAGLFSSKGGRRVAAEIALKYSHGSLNTMGAGAAST
nr:hypothetical protein CFP56_03368 [Quercus suber]